MKIIYFVSKWNQKIKLWIQFTLAATLITCLLYVFISQFPDFVQISATIPLPIVQNNISQYYIIQKYILLQYSHRTNKYMYTTRNLRHPKYTRLYNRVHNINVRIKRLYTETYVCTKLFNVLFTSKCFCRD